MFKMLSLATNKNLITVFAGLLAFAVPAIILGRAVLGVALILSLAVIVTLPRRAECCNLFHQAMRTNLAKLVGFTALVWLVSLTASSDMLKSFFTEFRLILFIIAATGLWAALSAHRESIRVYMKALILCSLILGAIAVFSLEGPFELINYIRGYADSGITARIILKAGASASVLLIPVLVWAGCILGGKWRLLSAMAIVEQGIMILETSSRSALAGLLAMVITSGLVLAISKQNTKARMMWAAVIICSLMLTLMFLYTTRYWTVALTDQSQWAVPVWIIDQARQGIWAFAWTTSEEWRWFGVGINAIDSIPQAQDLNTATNIKNIPLHPHNWVVEIIVETGIVGFSVMFLTILYCALTYVRRYLRYREPAILALIAVWAGYWGSGLFNFSYWSAWWQVSFLVMTAVCLAGRENVTQKSV